mgnify:CR=1 FL=1
MYHNGLFHDECKQNITIIYNQSVLFSIKIHLCFYCLLGLSLWVVMMLCPLERLTVV